MPRPPLPLLGLLVASAGVIAVTSPAGTAENGRATTRTPSEKSSGAGGCPGPARERSAAVPTHAPAAPAVGPVGPFRRLSERFARGGQPVGEEAFAFLARAGVKTVVSVDGAIPDVATARRHGLRYAHVPLGYDGIPPEKATALTKAFLEFEGPFYVHCHHGKHRGPAACSLGRMLVDGISADAAVAEMREAGTDARYTGLYAAPREYRRPTPAELAAAGNVPETAPVPAFKAAMVEVDARWERLKAVRAAGWKAPPDHPDVDPAHEATMLAEYLRELGRRDEVRARPTAFRESLSGSEKAAWDLSAALARRKAARDPGASGSDGTTTASDAQAAFDRIQANCASCHTTFRDVAASRAR